LTRDHSASPLVRALMREIYRYRSDVQYQHHIPTGRHLAAGERVAGSSLKASYAIEALAYIFNVEVQTYKSKI
jgi:hypothetical protein